MSVECDIELIPEDNRLVTYPICRPDIYKFYTLAIRSFWLPTEISLSKERSDFEKLCPDTQKFVEWVLAFFAASDGIINANIIEMFQMNTQAHRQDF